MDHHANLRPKLNLRSNRSRGRNFRINFNMLQIFPALTTLFFAICKKLGRRVPGTRSVLFPFYSEFIFLYFYSFDLQKASLQNVVSTQPSSTPHMVNFLSALQETRPMHSSRRLLYFITAWILLIRFAARLVPSGNLIVFLLKN